MITYSVSSETREKRCLFNVDRYHKMTRNKCFYYYFLQLLFINYGNEAE